MKTMRYTRLLAVSLLIVAMAGVSPRAAQQAPAQSTTAGTFAAKAQPPGGGKETSSALQEPDSDGDGLFDSEEPNILVDVNHPELGFLDPLNPDTGDTGKPDGDKDCDHDGITNLGELRTFGSEPSNAGDAPKLRRVSLALPGLPCSAGLIPSAPLWTSRRKSKSGARSPSFRIRTRARPR